MKRIVFSIVGVLAVLWIALFMSEKQVLIWETFYSKEDCEKDNKNPSDLISVIFKWDGEGEGIEIDLPRHSIFLAKEELKTTIRLSLEERGFGRYGNRPKKVRLTCDDFGNQLDCRYFNGRQIIRAHKEKNVGVNVCPNFRNNQ